MRIISLLHFHLYHLSFILFSPSVISFTWQSEQHSYGDSIDKKGHLSDHRAKQLSLECVEFPGTVPLAKGKIIVSL